MKNIILLGAFIGLIHISCNKTASIQESPSSLDGKWRMVLVKDDASGQTTVKPASIEGNVDITFRSLSPVNGIFFGNTPTNDIGKNAYAIGTNQSLTIPGLSMTKVQETSWGREFVDNIRNSQKFSFEAGNKLNITTANKTLTFQKF